MASPAAVNPEPGRDLVLVHSLRGAMHVHRADDLGLLTAALRPDDAGDGDGDALDQIAQAMVEAIDEGETCSKGQLSTRLASLVPPRLRAWCPSCQAEHVPDGVFRAATLPAGLRLRPVGNRSATFVRTAAPQPGASEPARRELLRRFLRRCGPADANDLAAWIGATPPVARRWWALLADELIEVRVDGQGLWMHHEDLAVARQTSIPMAVRLLPPYDPLTEIAHRKLLLPDAARRRQVWRAVTNPGVLFIAGEQLAGTWRRRSQVITIAPFSPLSIDQQQAIQNAALSDTTVPSVDVVLDV